jgi:Alkylmercury lyase
MNASESFDAKLRFYTYQHFVQHARAPKVSEAAQALDVAESEARAGYQRLTEGHAIMLTEPSGEIWRAAPFSAIPTAFPVRSGARSWFANCVWDALGIPAALHQDAISNAACGCCNRQMTLEVKAGSLLGTEGVIHFAVPARSWYEDVVFT